MGMPSLLFCWVSFTLPLFVAAGNCTDVYMHHEMISEGQPFPFNCTYPPVTNGAVNLTWHRTPSKSPISNNRHLRIHQDQSWILFLPLALEDSGIYQCVIKTNLSLRNHILYTVNITFLEVKMEDYGRPFTCHAGVSAAYIILKRPAPDFRAYLIGGLMAFLLLAVSILYIYNTFKVDIVLWYRSTFYTAQAPDDEKLYDAYVLYPKYPRESQGHDVDTLVLKILPEVLEKQCGYKLFIFGRDEFPGQAVASVIDENIKLCRRLMVLVAPETSSFSFLKNLTEEQIAVYNALVQDGMKVILIELERVKDYSTMPESIQYIRQKHGAIQWDGDFTEQAQCAKTKFWKKVRYHMPPRRYPASSPVQLLGHTPRIPG